MTVAQLQARLDLYLAAEAAILTGSQSWEVDGASFTKADLSAIRKAISELEASISAAQRGGGGFSAVQVVF
ncbi:hypothetical protein [Nitratidesulfovibrio sp. 1201_IL3209]|uniref:hypothetical protein n=1 Tax=Nitratidesulfovibrio sp. 1201_IL3209 TaxID=3084053 RepID=UPI002FD8F7C9